MHEKLNYFPYSAARLAEENKRKNLWLKTSRIFTRDCFLRRLKIIYERRAVMTSHINAGDWRHCSCRAPRWYIRQQSWKVSYLINGTRKNLCDTQVRTGIGWKTRISVPWRRSRTLCRSWSHQWWRWRAQPPCSISSSIWAGKKPSEHIFNLPEHWRRWKRMLLWRGSIKRMFLSARTGISLKRMLLRRASGKTDVSAATIPVSTARGATPVE